MTVTRISIKKNHPSAKLPTRAHEYDAGHDLYSVSYGLLEPGKRMLVDTGLSMAIESGYFGRICDRSGLALKNGIHVLGGIIDAQYRGSVGVILVNLSQTPFLIEEGARIAQLVIQKCDYITWKEVAELDDTARSSEGFGSSGS